MNRKWCVCVVCCTLAAVVTAADVNLQGTPTRNASPEYKNLARLVGTWKSDAMLKPGPGGPGGPVNGTETCRMFELFLVCDSVESGAVGRVNTHSMLIYHPAQKKYQRFSISNTSPYQDYFEGTNVGNVWIWSNEVEIDGKKVLGSAIVTETSTTIHTLMR